MDTKVSGKGLTMDHEVEKRFDKIDTHLKLQDEHLGQISKSFTTHERDDAIIHERIANHLEASKESASRRLQWNLAKVGVIAAVIAALVGAWYANNLEHRATRSVLEQIKAEKR